MCVGVTPSGLPMLMSMMSSPRLRAACFNSPVMLKTYGGRRLMRGNSLMLAVARPCAKSLIVIMLPEALHHSKGMKLHLARNEGRNVVTGYGARHVLVNGRRFERSLVVLPDRLIEEWGPSGGEQLSAEAVSRLAALE